MFRQAIYIQQHFLEANNPFEVTPQSCLAIAPKSNRCLESHSSLHYLCTLLRFAKTLSRTLFLHLRSTPTSHLHPPSFSFFPCYDPSTQPVADTSSFVCFNFQTASVSPTFLISRQLRIIHQHLCGIAMSDVSETPSRALPTASQIMVEIQNQRRAWHCLRLRLQCQLKAHEKHHLSCNSFVHSGPHI
jgi:hypothetical protein